MICIWGSETHTSTNGIRAITWSRSRQESEDSDGRSDWRSTSRCSYSSSPPIEALLPMVFELHVWGPAFGLPSIDPSCLATVAYLNHTVPHGQWSLVADHDTSLSPRRMCTQTVLLSRDLICSVGDFPLLIDADQRITGFTNIVTYLCDNYGEAYNIDAALKHKQSIDRTA